MPDFLSTALSQDSKLTFEFISFVKQEVVKPISHKNLHSDLVIKDWFVQVYGNLVYEQQEIFKSGVSLDQ